MEWKSMQTEACTRPEGNCCGYSAEVLNRHFGFSNTLGRAVLRGKRRIALFLLMAMAVVLCMSRSGFAQLADSPWPMRGHDARHTGQSPYNVSQIAKLKWKFPAGSSISSSPAIGSDRTVYLGSKDDHLYAINSDGTLRWKFRTGDSVWSSPALGSDGTTYVGSKDDHLYAINPDGSLKWKFKTGDDISSSPAIGSDGTVYVGSDDSYLYAINPDGSLKWKFETGSDVRSSPAIGSDGTVYVGSYDNHLHAINPDGNLKWKFEIGDRVHSSPAIGSDRTVYLGSKDDHLYAINSDGSLKWKFETGDNVRSPALGSDGTVYVGSYDRHLYAINPDGSLKWKFKTGGDVRSSPAIDSDGIVYVGSRDNHLYAINPDSSLKWKFKTGSYIYSSPAIDSDGTVYVGSYDNHLYALGKRALNDAPVLHDGKVLPQTGSEHKEFIFSVIYADADNDAPSNITVRIDDEVPEPMSRHGGDGNFVEGVVYEYRTKLSQGNHTFSFAADDGEANATGDIITYAGPTVVPNDAPVLHDGKVLPQTGARNTDFTFRAAYTDADNDPPDNFIVRIDDHAPQPMTSLNADDTDYINGQVYEYKTELSPGEHTYAFAADDGYANATGDTAVHLGPIVSVNAAPVLSDSSVTPHSGGANTEFIFKITYTDADNDPPSRIAVKIAHIPYSMTPVEIGDTHYTDGRVYEYKTRLSVGKHIFAFAANDGLNGAIGDIGSYIGPVVLLPGESVKPIPGQWKGNASFTVSDDSASILDFRKRVTVSGGGNIFGGGEWTEISRHAERADIVNNKFKIVFSSSTGLLNGVYSGRFTSPVTAEGTWEDYAVGSEIRPGTYNVMHGSGNWKASWSVTPYVEPPGAPIVTDIPDQSIDINGRFTEIRLDDYVSDPDNTDPQISWTYNGSAELTISISNTRLAAVTAPEPGWIGSETITFTATDPNGLSDSDSATFTIKPLTLLGDVNNDGRIRSDDAILVLRIAAGLMEPTEQQESAADMNKDGVVKSNDAILVLRKAAGLAAPRRDMMTNANSIKQISVALTEAHGVAGESVTVPLRMDDVSGLAGGDIYVAYDGAVLRAVDVSSDPNVLLVSNIAEPGIVHIAFAGIVRLNGNMVAKIKFDILTDDVSPLKLKSVELYRPDGFPIDSRKTDGRFSSWAIPPEHSALMQNFPNPFNPETWIPYQLRIGSEVTIRIYSATGSIVRELNMGYKPTGVYISRDRAAYWDGKNKYGMDVASGVYFYSILAGDFSAVRKLSILK